MKLKMYSWSKQIRIHFERRMNSTSSDNNIVVILDSRFRLRGFDWTTHKLSAMRRLKAPLKRLLEVKVDNKYDNPDHGD